jgi:serine/threonine protein kinase
MSAEPRRVTKTEVWTEWENQVVNGIFPLRRCLGGSSHSAVFLTEYKAENLPDVAIKFVPADTLQTQDQLVQWGAAAALSHPHLVRIFDAGRCQLGGRPFLFVVMEYAEQTLAQILPRRALSPDETREMLLPTLDALAFLHRNQLVHGQLKPSNVLVVNDQLKLASDTVRPIGSSTSGLARTSSYDPPELKDGGIATAGDVWSLGITLVETLTQRAPAWPDEQYEGGSLPASFPAPFVDSVRRCLSVNPAIRPTVLELETLYKPAPPAIETSVLQPPAHEAPPAPPAPPNSPKRRSLLPGLAAAILISLAVWIVLRSSHDHPLVHQSASDTSQADPQAPASSSDDASAAPAPTAALDATAPEATLPEPESAPAAPDPAVPDPAGSSVTAKSPASNSAPSSLVAPSPDQPSPPVTTSLSVLHPVSPDVSRTIRERIRGHINVTVRVLVDPSGDVVGEFFEHPGPSRYFARLAGDAAEQWKFAPTDDRGPRVWLLHFEFNRTGVAVHATDSQ